MINWIRRIFKKREPAMRRGMDNSTRVVEAKSGMKVECYNDWPDEI